MRKDRNTEEDPTCAAMINEGRRGGKREREREEEISLPFFLPVLLYTRLISRPMITKPRTVLPANSQG